MNTEVSTNGNNDIILKFGKKMKHDNAWYYFDTSIVFTNHGGLGRVPKSIIKKRQELQLMMESSPDIFYRITSYKLWHDSRLAMANYLNVNVDNLILCQNTTAGINSILNSINFEVNNDVILATEFTYEPILNAIDNTSKYRFDQDKHIQVLKLDISFPIDSVQTIVNKFEKICKIIVNEKKLNLRLAVIDHISSSIATLYPVKEIIQIIRKWNSKTIILIDGAHAIGQINIKLNELDCDFYVSSLHKWFLSPRGCSFLYFKNMKLVESLQPNYISYGYKKSIFLNFKQRASEDMTSCFMVRECIQFYEEEFGGLTTITEYCSEMLERAVALLVNGWQTSTLAIPKQMEAPFMKVIKLPKLKFITIDDCYKLSNYIIAEYNIVVHIIKIADEYFVRISCFVYNDIDDYIALRDAILDLKEKQIQL